MNTDTVLLCQFYLFVKENNKEIALQLFRLYWQYMLHADMINIDYIHNRNHAEMFIIMRV